jgi:hypothetical protein
LTLYFNYDNIIDERKVIQMLVQLLDAIDADDYETIKQILDKMEGEANNE